MALLIEGVSLINCRLLSPGAWKVGCELQQMTSDHHANRVNRVCCEILLNDSGSSIWETWEASGQLAAKPIPPRQAQPADQVSQPSQPSQARQAKAAKPAKPDEPSQLAFMILVLAFFCR